MTVARRDLMGGLGGAGLLAIAAAAFAEPDTQNPPIDGISPDAELIAACAAFDETERRFQYICNVQFKYDDDASDAATAAMAPKREALLDRICDLRAVTLEGFKARAHTLTLFRRDLMDDPEEYHDQRMLAALLRDMTGGQAA